MGKRKESRGSLGKGGEISEGLTTALTFAKIQLFNGLGVDC